MLVMGINAFHGDASAVLLDDGALVAAVEEERFTRVKHCAGFPRRALLECLRIAGASAGEISHFGISRNPRAHLLRRGMFAIRRRPQARFLLDRIRNVRQVSDVARAIARPSVPTAQ